jgi:hypothetical protein
MSDNDKRERYLASQRRYNQSRKGQARYARYEAAHPDRKVARWEPSRDALHAAMPEPTDLEARLRRELTEAARAVPVRDVDILARVRDRLRDL